MPPALRPEPRPVRLGVAVAGIGPALAEVVVSGVTLDSRGVQPGDLYAALPGRVTHGARFADAAARAGAAAILTDPAGAEVCASAGLPVVVMDDPRRRLGPIASRIYGDPSTRLQMLAVTGTNGKTTVATMIESGLRASGRVTGLIGTVGLRIAGTDHPGVRTTPEAPDLHAALAVMIEHGVQSVVMEASSIALDEARLEGVRFDVAAFTQLTQDHLDYHGTMEDYYRAKARLFEPSRAARGVVGVDDDWGRRLAAEAPIPLRTWSLLDPHADWHVVREGGQTIVIGPGAERQPIVTPMPGAFNVANAVCAFAVLRAAGVGPQAAAEGIATATVPGRMQVVGAARGVRGIVDYAHSPDAIERVLRSAREEADARVIVVIGAGGDRDRGKRPQMGETAAQLADVVVITDDNPRSEDPAAIRAAVREGTRWVSPVGRADVYEEADRARAITVAVGLARTGDVVLVLGKGHEQGQEANGVITPFDDASVLRAALAGEDEP